MALVNGVLEPAKGKAAGPTPEYFIAYQLVCGLYYYFYNELAFVVLDMLDAVSQAVANTVKRVVVIIAGTIIFAKPLTTNGMVGSSVAIAGVLLYSLAIVTIGGPRMEVLTSVDVWKMSNGCEPYAPSSA